MINRVDMEIKGIDEVANMLATLPPEIVSKRGGPVRAALRKAAIVIQKEAQKNVRAIVAEPNKDGKPSKSTGALEKAISVGRGKYLGGNNGERYLVWIPKLKQKYANTRDNVRKRRAGKTYYTESPQFYGRFLEYGTAKMSAKPFMRPAVMNKGAEAINVAKTDLLKRIDAIAQKLLKGQ